MLGRIPEAAAESCRTGVSQPLKHEALCLSEQFGNVTSQLPPLSGSAWHRAISDPWMQSRQEPAGSERCCSFRGTQTFRREAPKAEQTPVSLERCLDGSQASRVGLSSANNLTLPWAATSAGCVTEPLILRALAFPCWELFLHEQQDPTLLFFAVIAWLSHGFLITWWWC